MTRIIILIDIGSQIASRAIIPYIKIRKMYVILFLIALSLLVALGFLVAFIWAVKTGQYEDDYTPAMRVLFDDESTDIK